MKNIFKVGLISLSLVISSISFGQEKQEMTASEKAEKRAEKLTKELGLNESQKSQFIALETEAIGKRQALREKVKPLKEEVKTAKESGDKAKRKEVGKKLKPYREEAKANKEAYMAKMKEILTAEQYTKWEAMIKEKKANRKAKRKASKE